MPPQCNELTTIVYRVIIPADYSKDVYYWNYQNRKELFRYSDYCHIPVYFPIPVLKRKMYNIFYYIDPYGNNYQFIRLFVTVPLQLIQTLKDVPLRRLKDIRFSAQLEFTIEETLKDAMKSNTILELLVKDIKRERIGKELATTPSTNYVSYRIEKCINCGYYEQIIGFCKTIDTLIVICCA
ncbi:hypothetical protein QTN25_008102 [Entamoeba marina]